MIRCKIGDNTMRIAEKQAREMGRLNNSITKGAGNVAGFVGELVVSAVLDAKQSNTYEYDLLLPDGKTVDVKTKRTTVTPQQSYECSVRANHIQECDYYAFVRVNLAERTAWFLGLVDHDEYMENATLLKQGEIVDSNDFVVKKDCYNMSIKEVGERSQHDNYIRRRELGNEEGRKETS